MNRKESELATSEWLQHGELLARRQLLCEKELRESLLRIGDQYVLQEVELDDRSRESEGERLMNLVRGQGAKGVRYDARKREEDIARALSVLSEQEASLTQRQSFLTVTDEQEPSRDVRYCSTAQPAQRQKVNVHVHVPSKGPTVMTASEAYQTFVTRHGGMSLGWNDADHNTFLGLVARGLGQLDIMEEMRQRRPHLASEDVMHHASLYEEFQRLLHNKRVEIEAFRAQREEDERAEALARAAEDRQRALEAGRDDAIAEQRRVKHALEIKARLEMMHKAKEAAAAVEQGKATTFATGACRKEAARLLRDRTNNEIQAYLEKKAALSRNGIMDSAAAQHSPRQQPSVRDFETTSLRRRWEEDKRKAELRLAKVSMRSQRDELAASRLQQAAAKLAPRVESSFDRLVVPTASSRARSAATRDVTASNETLFPHPVGHKAKVAWCGPAYLR